MIKQELIEDIVRQRINGWTFQEIGDYHGLTKQRVHQIFQKNMLKPMESAIYKSYLSIWRDYMEKGEDMKTSDQIKAEDKVAKDFGVMSDGVWKIIKRKTNEELKPVYLPKYNYALQGYTQ